VYTLTINIKTRSVKLAHTIFIRAGSKFKYGEIADGDAVTARIQSNKFTLKKCEFNHNGTTEMDKGCVQRHCDGLGPMTG